MFQIPIQKEFVGESLPRISRSKQVSLYCSSLSMQWLLAICWNLGFLQSMLQNCNCNFPGQPPIRTLSLRLHICPCKGSHQVWFSMLKKNKKFSIPHHLLLNTSLSRKLLRTNPEERLSAEEILTLQRASEWNVSNWISARCYICVSCVPFLFCHVQNCEWKVWWVSRRYNRSKQRKVCMLTRGL